MGLSIAALVLGITSLFSGPVTGVPAVVCGGMALARRQRPRGMAIAGIATGVAGTLLVTAFWVLVFALMARTADTVRREQVWRNTGLVHTAMENWYVTHLASYPGPGVSWDPAAREPAMVHCFPGGDPEPPDGPPVPGEYPVNPYTGRRYEYGTDLFYFPDRLEPGQHDVVDGSDPACPFRGLAAPGGRPGTVVVLGGSRAVDGTRRLERYAVTGYGRDISEPMHEEERRGAGRARVYRVRWN